MELTQPVDWLKKPYTGYVVNTPFSDENIVKIKILIEDIENEFGEAVFCMPEKALHTTLLDWIAPLVDYGGQDKEDLFKQIQEAYDRAMTEVISSEAAFTTTFDEIHVSPSTIFMTGHDNGQFKRMRDAFVANVTLLTGTKQPPTIIHSSLARFTKPVPMDQVREFLQSKTIDLSQNIDTFRLVRTQREPMLEFDVLKEYHLKQKGIT